jgi:ATP-dependent Clp protease ATP-binding subunit ClpB
LKKLETELADLELKSGELTERWTAEKEKLAGAQALKEELDSARFELEQSQREENLARAGEIAYGIIPKLERKVAEAEIVSDDHMLNEEVTESDIAGVVSRWTEIPVDKMLEGERKNCCIWKTHLRAGSLARARPYP